ncbi:hypothetical protein BDZ89DRAFT_1070218 [Hymenopellis radicata]|nr:hypothetical protein BDZ89DRAFT_1070218 [Hymenopellis radicata]
MSITSSGRGNPLDFPQELTDEIISHNQDDIEFILTASLVSKAWRDTALRHLFSKASFLCKADLLAGPQSARLCLIHQFHLASFPELEDRAMFSPGGSTARALKDTVTTRGPLEYISSFRTALDCRFPADSDFELFLCYDVFSKSLPPLRRIGWGFDYPAFTPAAFVRFLSMISGTLEEISIGIPTESIDWDIPEFASGAILPVLRVLTIKTHYTDSRVLPWVGSILPVFPLCPTLDRFELSCFVSDPDDITGTFVHPLMDWTSLLDDRYPSLEVVEFEMAMELDEVFDFEERTRLEAVVRDNVNIDRLAVKWGDSPREVHPWT